VCRSWPVLLMSESSWTRWRQAFKTFSILDRLRRHRPNGWIVLHVTALEWLHRIAGLVPPARRSRHRYSYYRVHASYAKSVIWLKSNHRPLLSRPPSHVEPQRSGLGRRETRGSHAIATPGSTVTGVVPANSCITGSP
jgi:hypothetical protein